VRVGLVILPTDPWSTARSQWEWADDVGFSTGWTYDHIRWGGMPDGPWRAAIPVLAAAAVTTERIRLGTLVATPNFRHPVVLGRDAITLDDISAGRLELGVGPGSEGHDAIVLGQNRWSRRDRMVRYGAFLEVLRAIVDGEPSARVSMRNPHYGAQDVPSTPGPIQRPLPLTIAAGGPVGLRLAVRFGQQWVTTGPTGAATHTPDATLEAVTRQVAQLRQACVAAGREPSSLRRVLLWMPTEPVIDSVDQFDEVAEPFAALGFDEIVLHHPSQTGPFRGSMRVFEEIAARHASGSKRPPT
jgi:alkanesulfonate monooxygenase SsuD/methylene tetrahydromethanopterin reductase-like flavin-dependent oxidoreductase (luciferase family)